MGEPSINLSLSGIGKDILAVEHHDLIPLDEADGFQWRKIGSIGVYAEVP
jgi:hypothetical protein